MCEMKKQKMTNNKTDIGLVSWLRHKIKTAWDMKQIMLRMIAKKENMSKKGETMPNLTKYE